MPGQQAGAPTRVFGMWEESGGDPKEVEKEERLEVHLQAEAVLQRDLPALPGFR